MQFGKWITGAIVSAGLLAGSPAFEIGRAHV